MRTTLLALCPDEVVAALLSAQVGFDWSPCLLLHTGMLLGPPAHILTQLKRPPLAWQAPSPMPLALPSAASPGAWGAMRVGSSSPHSSSGGDAGGLPSPAASHAALAAEESMSGTEVPRLPGALAAARASAGGDLPWQLAGPASRSSPVASAATGDARAGAATASGEGGSSASDSETAAAHLHGASVDAGQAHGMGSASGSGSSPSGALAHAHHHHYSPQTYSRWQWHSQGHGPLRALPAGYGAVLANVNRELAALSLTGLLRQVPATVVRAAALSERPEPWHGAVWAMGLCLLPESPSDACMA